MSLLPLYRFLSAVILSAIPGPSAACRKYETSLLKEHDIQEIVNRINEKRNLVALGFSRKLPEAANMRKISWSEELATIAQRWADQCDPFTRPNRHDSCRDLTHTAVGQNIASISGPSPGLHVKSFIDMWFIQILEYNGSVSYYNESRDNKSNYFTQLIWAESDIVGCGRAKFFIEYRNTVIERLVCNFATKGNVNRKPVYAVGYAATQCPENMAPDVKFKGLCRTKRNGGQYTSTKRPVSSLLRILNLSNNNTKQEIDPIKNNLKQNKLDGNNTSDQRNQKIRHIYNDTYGLPPVWQQQMNWNNAMNMSRNYMEHYHHPERGHSRVYHGHEHKDNFMTQYKGSSNQDLRKYDYTTKPLNYFTSADYRKHLQHCTRRDSGCNDCYPATSGCAATNGCPARCTRGQNHDCTPPTPPCQTTYPSFVFPRVDCPCNSQRTSCAPPSKCSCQCPNAPAHRCQNIARTQDNDEIKDDTRKSADLHYYDFSPNLAIRSGDLISEKSSERETKKKPWLLRSTLDGKQLISETFLTKRRDYNRNSGQVKDVLEYAKYIDQEHDYSYGSFDSSERLRRQETQDQMTFKPFWQLDDYSQKKLKSLKYTTLSSRRNRKGWKSPHFTMTESITIALRDEEVHRNHADHFTEKYLSFDELMHLRKFGSGDINARRQAKTTKKAVVTKATTKGNATTKKGAVTVKTTAKGATKATAKATTKAGVKTTAKGTGITTAKATVKTTKAAATTKTTATLEYTTNTPFERKKHCTRELTCTWTVPTVTGNDGRVIPGGGGGSGGKRTPPGYVDGCTRTSTCTRDYMNRNKMVTIPGQISGDSGETTEEDEDYCEKRDLNIQRRNLGEDVTVRSIEVRDVYTDVPTSTEYFTSKFTTDQNGVKPPSPETDCVCYEENLRKKRYSNRCDRSQTVFENTFSYGDLFYVILKKIMNNRKNKSHECSCNTGYDASNFRVSILLCLLCSAFI